MRRLQARRSRPAAVSTLATGALILALVLAAYFWSPTPRLIHTEPSEFEPVLVFEADGQRCMDFTDIDDGGRHTCMGLDDPDKMVFEYTRMMTSALFVNPEPTNVLIIGLGGATLPRALANILPKATIDTVEIDPAVGRVAERYFGYQTGPRQRLFIEDGRAFVERALREGRQYDMVMLDAFDIDYIPPHLLTLEFLEQVHAILASRGVLVANTFTNSTMYDRESATYAAVFGDFFNLRAGNRVIIATRDRLPDNAALNRNAKELAATLSPFGIDVARELARFSRHRDWDDDAAVLRD